MPVVPLFDSQAFILARPDSGAAQRYLRLHLEDLPRAYRIGFAAACVERHAPLLGGAAGVASEAEELGIGLDLVWDSLLRQAMDRDWLAGILQASAELFRRRACGTEPGLRAMLACLEAAQTGECEPVLRVSENLVRALETRAFAATGARRQDPGIRLERQRQHRDLCELRRTAAAPSPNLIRRLRDRAAMEAAMPIEDWESPAPQPAHRQAAR